MKETSKQDCTEGQTYTRQKTHFFNSNTMKLVEMQRSKDLQYPNQDLVTKTLSVINDRFCK